MNNKNDHWYFWLVLGLFGTERFGAYVRQQRTAYVVMAIILYATYHMYVEYSNGRTVAYPLMCLLLIFLFGPMAKRPCGEVVRRRKRSETECKLRPVDTLIMAYCFFYTVAALSIYQESDLWQVTANPPKWTGERKAILWGVLTTGIPVVMWIDTLLHADITIRRFIPAMATIFFRSRRGRTLTLMVICSVANWYWPFRSEPLPYRREMTATVLIAVFLLWLQPPYALVLAASSRETGKLLKSFSVAAHPFRVVGLLDRQKLGFLPRYLWVMGAYSLFTDDLRVVDSHDWRRVVDRLMDLVPLIVLDARSDSAVVAYEAGEILRDPRRLERAVFVVRDDGSAPALAAHGKTRESPGIESIRIKEIGPSLQFGKLINRE